MDNTQDAPTVLSFCTGYAGLELGLELAGVRHRVVTYVEIEAFAIANLVDKMEANLLGPAPVFTDLKKFPSGLFRGKVDLITGGYPCQPFSAAGKRSGADDPRHLWPFILHHIREINPRRVFFENVEGHITLGLPRVLQDLEDLGYHTTWGIFSASEAGAPHQRKRVYIMGDNGIQDGDGRETNPFRTDPDSWGRQHIRPSMYQRWRLERGIELRDQQVGESEPICPAVCDPPKQRLEVSSGERETLGKPGQESKPERSGVLPREDIPDTQGERVQGLRASGQQEPDSHGQEELPVCQSETRRYADWVVEPDVDRVVDGCPDRVDRIRLLGNGVVPETAAVAWTVLETELEILG